MYKISSNKKRSRTPISPYFVGKGKTVSSELQTRGVKLIDIAYVAAIYLTLGAVLSIAIDRQLGKFDSEEADLKSTAQLYGEVLLHFAGIGILMYIVRNIVEWIPFPLNGMYGYDHMKLNELKNAGLFGVIFFLFQNNLKDKLVYLSTRF